MALIGRNGTGKSSLLKILAGHDRPDDGVLQVQSGVRRVYVAQEPALEAGASVFDAVPSRPAHRPPSCAGTVASRC